MFDLFNYQNQDDNKDTKVNEDTKKNKTETGKESVEATALLKKNVSTVEVSANTSDVVVTKAELPVEEVTTLKDKPATTSKTTAKNVNVSFEVDVAAIVRYCGESIPLTDFFGIEEIQEGLTAEKVRKRLESDYPELVSSHTEVLSIKKKDQIFIVPTLKAKKKGCTAELSQSIPYSILNQFEQIAKEYAQKRLEVHGDIYYCYERKQYILDIPKQMVSPVNCEVIEDMASIIERVGFDTKKVAEIHSHHFMRAIPSNTDDLAERVPGMNYFILGEIQNQSPSYFGRRFISDEVGWTLLDTEAIFSKVGV